MRIHLVSSSLAALLVPLSLNVVACSSSDDGTTPALQPTADAATDHEAADAPGEGSPVDSAPSPDAAPEAGTPSPLVFFSASDFTTGALVTALDLAHPATPAPQPIAVSDQDTIVVADGPYAFALHRTNGSVSVLDAASPTQVLREIDVSTGLDAGKANPYAVIVPAASKAYVLRYGQNTVAAIDPQAGSVTAEIDLSEYVADADGLVDAFAGAFDPATGLAYIGLQRIDQNEFGGPPDYVGLCSATKAAIVAIDTSNDTVVDANGSADGVLIEVDAANPSALLLDATTHRLVVFGVGCATAEDGGQGREGRGVQAVNLADGTRSWLWQTTELQRPAALLWMSSHEAIVGLDDDSFTRHWYAWDPGQPMLGNELSGLPLVPVWDGGRGLVGLGDAAGGSGLDAVRYDLDDQTSSVLAAGAFGAAGYFAYSSAVSR